MTRKELDTYRSSSLKSLFAVYNLTVNPPGGTCELRVMLDAAAAMHAAACRELALCPDPEPTTTSFNLIRLALGELDKALSDSAIPKEHVRLAMRILLQILRPPGDDYDIQGPPGEEGFSP